MLALIAALGVVLAAGGGGGGGAPADCPKGTQYHEGGCIEKKLRPDPLTWREANLFCLDEGRRIPALAELQTFLPTTDTDPTTLEWHNLRYRAGAEELAGLVSGDGQLEIVSFEEEQVYRCVAAPE